MGVANSTPNKGKKNTPYDLICRIDSLLNGDQGWLVEVHGQNLVWDGCVVGVMGVFNRGKSFVLSRLVGVTFEQGYACHTEGLSLKFLQGKKRHVILDVAGLHSPVNLKSAHTQSAAAAKPHTSNSSDKDDQKSPSEKENDQFAKLLPDKTSTEDFLNSLVLTLSDYVVIVINDLTRLDQAFLEDVALKRENTQRSFKGLFIVNNWKHVSTPTDHHSLWESLCELYPGNRGTTILKPEVNVDYFTSKNDKIRHVCLLDDKTSYGHAHNDKVFELLRRWIDSIVPTSFLTQNPNNNQGMALSPFIHAANSLLPAHFENFGKLEFNNSTQKLIISPVAGTKLRFKKGPEEKIQEFTSFAPAHRIEKTPKEYRIILDLPGMGIEDIAVKRVKGNVPDTFRVSVSGVRKLPDTQAVADTRPYGKFEVLFNIPIEYLAPKYSNLEGKCGQVTITWPFTEVDE